MKRIGDRLRQSLNGYDLVFWLLVVGCVAFALSSYPMLKLRFDMWQHIGNIDRLIFDPSAKISKSNWHATWAFIIRNLGPGDVFANATIVHRGQFILIGIIIYQAAKQIFSALLPSIEFSDNKNKGKWLSSLAISSVIVWFTIIGTVSTYQQAWIMWYSVNYQITLAFLFLALALFVNVVAVAQKAISKTVKLVGSLFLLVLIYLFHAGELAYLVFYLPILLLCFSNKENYKKTLIITLIICIVAFIAEKFYTDIRPALVKYLMDGNFTEISNEINRRGLYLIQGGNRYSGNWNELYALSALLAAPTTLIILLRETHINKQVILFIVLSLFFCFIPNFKYTSGITALISYDNIVNRYYFASFIFLLLPLFLYLISSHFKIIHSPSMLILFTLISIGLVFTYSKMANNRGVYYQNVKSIINSLDQKRVGIETATAEIESIGQQIKAAQAQYGTENIIYCSTYDKGHIVKYVYRQENIAFYRWPEYPLFKLDECLKHVKSQNKFAVVIN
jgi:hypothetical protein